MNKMKQNCFFTLVMIFAAATFVFTACDGSKQEKQAKQAKAAHTAGVLLVTFGSSYEVPHQTFKKVKERVQKEFPAEKIRLAFTSDFIINKLRAGKGEGALNGQKINISRPQEAIEAMLNEGYSKIAVQSLHVIPGSEYEQLVKAIDEVKNKHQGVEITLGKPLLDSDKDIEEVAKILAEKFKEEIKKGPVCFMGHGTPHQADHVYTKLEAILQKTNPHFFIGTVEGKGVEVKKSSIDAVIAKLRKLNPKPTQISISPLMSIVGDHANNDLNGVSGEKNPEEQSWRERLEAEGYKINAVMKGLADYPEIVAIWLSHLSNSKR
ncbi:MAG: hypothetical protein CSB01_00800 [Bacteroidia bacterium]|nr:MAG: hypothetical protein CSB01_00800 [Bacteroidia bacterium]